MRPDILQDSGADLALFLRRHPWLTSIVTVVTLCVIVFFCLEWRAEQRWQRYAAEARSRGVKLLLTDFARPEIPDEQNFAAVHFLRDYGRHAVVITQRNGQRIVFFRFFVRDLFR